MYQYIKSGFWKHWSVSLDMMLLAGSFMLWHDRFQVPNLMRIEFADSPNTFYQLVSKYQKLGCNPIYWNTLLDFVYMLAYTCLFYFSARIVLDVFELKPPAWIVLLFIPMLLDFVENMLVLQMLHVGPEEYYSFSLFYWTVRLKWAFVIPGIIISVVVLMYQLYIGIDRIYCWWIDRSGKTK